MPKNSTNIAKRIKEIRDNQRLSQERFAFKIGLSGKTISAYETGRSTPPLKVLERIVEVYDAPFIQMKNESKQSLSQRLQLLQDELVEIQMMLDGGIF